MSSPMKTVAIAGASGALGTPVTKALLAAGFTVTALTRPDSTATFPAGVSVSKVDYTSESSLRSALTGQDALISTLNTSTPGEQAPLLRAAVAAGVQRILPSEFGSDTTHPQTAALPVYKDKVDNQALLKRLCADSAGKSTYTLLANNAFLDWGIAHDFLIDPTNKTFTLIDGGNAPFTTAPLSFVAAAVVAVLRHPEETANQAVKVQGARISQREMLEVVQRVGGSKPEDWTVVEASSKTMAADAMGVLGSDPSNVPGWVFPMLKVAVFGEGYGEDFGAEGERWNGVLGLKELSGEEVEEVVRGVLGGK